MKEVNEKCMKKIYLNILKAIIIIAYFFVLNLASENVSTFYLEKGIELCTMIFLIAAICIFEVAYRKDNDDLAIQGIEVLILSAYTLTSQHITKKYNFDFKTYSLVASYIFAIYFILKCIVVYTKGRKEMAENLSDIKEIVQKDEPVKKEATKKKKATTTTPTKKTTRTTTKTKKEPATRKTSETKKETTPKKSTTRKPKQKSIDEKISEEEK